jgi:hypothetical protein
VSEGAQPTLGTLLADFQRTAFRLETRDRYTVDDEAETLTAYLRGDLFPPADPSGDSWQQLIRERVASGRTMSRVHAIGGALTPYLRYEIDWGYLYNAAAGERIQILHRADLRSVFGGVLPSDFWLFDDAVAVLMQYDDDGRLEERTVVTDPQSIAWHCRIRDVALAHAVPLREYLAALRHQPVGPSELLMTSVELMA